MKRRRIKKKIMAMQFQVLEQLEREHAYQADLQNQLAELSRDDVFKEMELRDNLEESMEHCKKLNAALDDYNKLTEVKWKVSLDTLLVVFGNLAGILLILNFEKLDIVRSKAMNFVLKGKL